MSKFFFILFPIFIFWVNNSDAKSLIEKPYSIIIKGGHVIDPKNNIDGIMDVAISSAHDDRPIRPGVSLSKEQEGIIAWIAKDIDPKLATKVIQANGLFVVPGLMDIHSHNFWGHDGEYQMNGPRGLSPDGFTFRTGVTTVVDVGGSGWRTFPLFKQQSIDRSQTRVLAMLNIVGEGMRGSKYEQNIEDMDPDLTAKVANEYKDLIVGVKLAHFNGHDWRPTDLALEAGNLANIPVMVDFGSATPFLPLEKLFLEKFRPGDIYTHCFGGNSSTSPNGRESIVDVSTNMVKPYVIEARGKGIVFDVGFGGASFLFSQGLPAVKNGFYPNTISTDIHIESMNNAMKDMLNVMSLFMAMDMPFKEVVKASTWNPAQAIKREDLGNLSIGSVADIAILKMNSGDYGFWARDGKITGTRRLQAEVTIRGGNIVYDLNGISRSEMLH